MAPTFLAGTDQAARTQLNLGTGRATFARLSLYLEADVRARYGLTALLRFRGNVEFGASPRSARSGLFFGLAFGMGAVGAAVLAPLADARGIGGVYARSAYPPLISLLAVFLPDLERPRSISVSPRPCATVPERR